MRLFQKINSVKTFFPIYFSNWKFEIWLKGKNFSPTGHKQFVDLLFDRNKSEIHHQTHFDWLRTLLVFSIK